MSFKGNAIVAQSGGPTSVINSSACGVIQAALKAEEITRVYGAHNGILGLLNNKIFDLGMEAPAVIEGLKYTPASALGTCRHKLTSDEEYNKIIDVLKKHNIRYFFYIGGNDSQDTANKIHKKASELGWELRVTGIPKTVDNDLLETDHCPGYGSVIKYLAAMAMEAGFDTEAAYSSDKVNILETMGRNSGWIAAGTALAASSAEEAPQLIILPEVPFEEEMFLAEVEKSIAKRGRCFIVVSEGAKKEDGSYLAEMSGAFSRDSFGHTQLGGTGVALKELIEEKLKLKTRHNRPSIASRAGAHFASLTDAQEAYTLGAEAVRMAISGESDGMMVALKRKDGESYSCEIVPVALSLVANGEKYLPEEYISENGLFITQAFRDYALPLIQGEVSPPIVNGLPSYVRLVKHFLGEC